MGPRVYKRLPVDAAQRKRIVEAHAAGIAMNELMHRFGLGAATIQRLVREEKLKEKKT